MYYEVHGDGEPVVCSSGQSTITGERLRILPPALRERYRVIVYDHRGLGQSAEGADRPNSTRQYARDVLGLMDHLGLERAHCFGRGGLGACVMQEVALAAPERVYSLVLSGGWAGPDPYHVAQQRIMEMLRERIGYEGYALASAVFTYTPEYFNAHADEFLSASGPRVEMKDRTAAHLRLMKAGQEHEARDRLGQVICPTLIVQSGEGDILTGARFGRELAALIPGSELVILEGAPHVINSVPAAFQRMGASIGDFLRRHPLPSAAPARVA